jgi:hypothetical protein
VRVVRKRVVMSFIAFRSIVGIVVDDELERVLPESRRFTYFITYFLKALWWFAQEAHSPTVLFLYVGFEKRKRKAFSQESNP